MPAREPRERRRINVKKGDTVLVISGNDKGKTGVVREARPRENRVLVEGVNLRWKHLRRSEKQQKGERVQREAPIDASNVRRVEGESGGKKKAARRPAAAPEKRS